MHRVEYPEDVVSNQEKAETHGQYIIRRGYKARFSKLNNNPPLLCNGAIHNKPKFLFAITPKTNAPVCCPTLPAHHSLLAFLPNGWEFGSSLRG